MNESLDKLHSFQKQSEALRLADILEHKLPSIQCLETAATELRRLHQSEHEGWRYADELEQERVRLNDLLGKANALARIRAERIKELEQATISKDTGGCRMKCIVKDCANHTHQGLFVGSLCSPCHTFITMGVGEYSQAYRNTKPAPELLALLIRYRTETPLGHQPHMIAHEADEAIAKATGGAV